jgi:mercuric ion transport protein
MGTTNRAGGLLGYISLFSSLSTLLCCALPSFFVLLGLGATVASVVSAAPWLITLSRHKDWTFAIAGVLIAANFVYIFYLSPRLQDESTACPVDGPSPCATASRLSRWILWGSAGVYVVGFFSAYLLGPILQHFG